MDDKGKRTKLLRRGYTPDNIDELMNAGMTLDEIIGETFRATKQDGSRVLYFYGKEQPEEVGVPEEEYLPSGDEIEEAMNEIAAALRDHTISEQEKEAHRDKIGKLVEQRTLRTVVNECRQEISRLSIKKEQGDDTLASKFTPDVIKRAYSEIERAEKEQNPPRQERTPDEIAKREKNIERFVLVAGILVPNLTTGTLEERKFPAEGGKKSGVRYFIVFHSKEEEVTDIVKEIAEEESNVPYAKRFDLTITEARRRALTEMDDDQFAEQESRLIEEAKKVYDEKKEKLEEIGRQIQKSGKREQRRLVVEQQGLDELCDNLCTLCPEIIGEEKTVPFGGEQYEEEDEAKAPELGDDGLDQE